MEHGSSSLISFLLAGFICAFAVVEGAEQCSFNISMDCFTRGRPEGKVSIDRIFSFFRRENLNVACNDFATLRTCIREKTRNCDPNEKNHFKKIWTKVEDSVNYVCDKNRQAFTAAKDCLSKQDLSAAAIVCENAHHYMHRRYARHTCSEYQQAVKCINNEVLNHCGTDSKNLMDRLVRNTLSLVDIDHDCEQSSSGRSKEDSVVISFIMCTASLMLALLLN